MSAASHLLLLGFFIRHRVSVRAALDSCTAHIFGPYVVVKLSDVHHLVVCCVVSGYDRETVRSVVAQVASRKITDERNEET